MTWVLTLFVGVTLAATGGPDVFGYTYIDSDEAHGPVYAWTDISTTGTDTALSDDGEFTISLPFSFYFYGDAYSAVTVGDGALLFGTATSINNRNACIPADNGDGDDALILPMWDDLNVEESVSGGVYWEILGTAPARSLVIQYQEVPHYGSSTDYSFQAILLEHGSQILFQYASVSGDDEFALGASATVGIQAGLGLGLEYACESPDTLFDGLALLFDVACDDLDGDGLGTCDGDCDDTDAQIGPHATETDDGLDNDCDGLVDEDYVVVGDVVINELMPDSLVSEDQTGEWFELANTSPRAVDLFGWSFADSGGSVTVDEHVVIPPGGFGLFAALAVPAGNGHLPPVDWVFDWNAIHLNNTGDSLTVRMGTVVIDELSYRPGPWEVPEGASMFLDPGFQSAELNDSPLPWCATPTELDYDYGGQGMGDFGTPGAANPPGLCCHDDDGDGWDLCEGDCDDENAERFPDNPEIQDLIDNDCDDVADEDWVELGQVVITEFLDEPSAVEQGFGEWFELLNHGATAMNLRGWRITDELGDGFQIVEDLIVEPGEYLLFAVQGDAALNGGLPEVDYVYSYAAFPLRSYDDDDIQVVFGEDLMDGVAYSNVAPWASEPGRSSYLCPGATDVEANDDPSWWAATPADASYAYGDGDHGTPGTENPGDVDGDGDGVGLCDGDCDDGDPAVGPGVAEDCGNALDDDCDGLADGDDPDCLPQDSDADTGVVEPTDSGDDTGDGDGDDAEGCGGCASTRSSGAQGLLLVLLSGLVARRRWTWGPGPQ